MKVLFCKSGKSAGMADRERLIFLIDESYYDKFGNAVPYEEQFQEMSARSEVSDDGWYQPWMDYEGLDVPLKAESTIEPVFEIDDVFGNYGFKNQAGDFVIEPQYAYAHEFTNGRAAVNLNRTWYKTEDGKRYYENHFGYIDSNGKTVIGFQFDEAYPFNRYGVAVVSDLMNGARLIDINGKEIPGTYFPYLSQYYDYEDRFLEFSYSQEDDAPVGIYDTKERRILLEPSIDSIIEYNEDFILAYERNGEYGMSDFHQYYMNSRGEILYPWLYGKNFAIVEKPDIHNVAAVAISQYTELTGNSSSYFPHNEKKYDRTFLYGLYSSKEEFLLPMEYEEIRQITDDIWACYKAGNITLVQTEPGD